MYEIIFSRHFKKSEKRLKHSGSYNKSGTDKVTKLLSQGVELPKVYRDHELRGDFNGYRGCHIESDLILLYQVNQMYLSVVLVNIGSHSDLFG